MTAATENNNSARRLSRILLIFATLLLIAACDRSVFFNESARIDELGWGCNDRVSFHFDTDDTATTYLFCIDIRNTVDYPYSNIFFNIKSVFPDGAVAMDTNIEFQLALPDGQWLGKASGKYVDGRYPLCFFRFPEPGTYQFFVGHAMRDTLLPGIKNIGLYIEKAGN